MRLSERNFLTLCLVAGGIAFIANSLDGHLYWHEGRLLYAVSHFSITQLIAGEFNPNQLGAAIDVASSSGYHTTKILYLFALKQLTSLPMSPDNQLLFGSIVSLLGVAFCGLVLRYVFTNLQFPRRVSNSAMISFFLLPWTPYLAGKLLSEVPALILASLSLWFWSKCVCQPALRNIAWVGAAAFFSAATALARLDIVIVQFGFAIATTVTAPSINVRRVLGVNATVLGIGAAIYLFVVIAAGGSLGSIIAYFETYLDLHPKSQLMSAFGLISFGGLVWVFAALSILGRKNERHFLLIWLAVTMIPILAIVSNYMVEPRYLTASSLPLAGLAGIGLAALADKVKSYRRRLLAVAGLTFVVAANGILVALMPYEIDRDAILEAVDHFAPVGSGATFLVSWSYTDFHFLRYARPSSRILNVCTPKAESLKITPEWSSRLKGWYGWRYIQDPETLNNAVDTGSIFYLGWGVYPPIATMRSWTESLGLSVLGEKLAEMNLMSHRDQSWVWESDRYDLEYQESFSQYEIYRLRPVIQDVL